VEESTIKTSLGMNADANITPITVCMISRAGIDRRAIRVLLGYELNNEEGHWTGGDLSIPDDLIDPLFLERFLAAHRNKARADAMLWRLRRIKDPSDAKPVVLREGTLCELLQIGIRPWEILNYCLDHGAARSRDERFVKWQSRAGKLPGMAKTLKAVAEILLMLDETPFVVPLSRGEPASTATWRSSLDADGNPVPLETPVETESRPLGITSPSRAEFLLSPIPPSIARNFLNLAADVNAISIVFRKYAPYLKRSAHRPSDDKEDSFIRDWAGLVSRVRMKNGRPKTLDRQGCELFNVTFQKKITPATFRRYRLGLKAASSTVTELETRSQ
jgi:hypothetical protein